MIFRSPLFSSPFFFLFLLAWHSVLDLHECSPDRKKKGYGFLERGTIFSFMKASSCCRFSLFNCCLIKRTMESGIRLQERDCLLRYD